MPAQATRLPLRSARFRCISGFTLAELLVTVGVLVLLVLLFTQLLNSAASITTLGHKQMDADSQARQLLDRMAIDFAQLVKRSDVDFFGKGTIAPNSVGGAMTGNDRIAFYSAVPGYYPSTGSQSPVSLVAYRVNSTRLPLRIIRWSGWEKAWSGTAFLPQTRRLFLCHSRFQLAGRLRPAVVWQIPTANYEIDRTTGFPV